LDPFSSSLEAELKVIVARAGRRAEIARTSALVYASVGDPQSAVTSLLQYLELVTPDFKGPPTQAELAEAREKMESDALAKGLLKMIIPRAAGQIGSSSLAS
jgi:hypothetical protein